MFSVCLTLETQATVSWKIKMTFLVEVLISTAGKEKASVCCCETKIRNNEQEIRRTVYVLYNKNGGLYIFT